MAVINKLSIDAVFICDIFGKYVTCFMTVSHESSLNQLTFLQQG